MNGLDWRDESEAYRRDIPCVLPLSTCLVRSSLADLIGTEGRRVHAVLAQIMLMAH